MGKGSKGRVVMETFSAMVPGGPKYGSEGPEISGFGRTV